MRKAPHRSPRRGTDYTPEDLEFLRAVEKYRREKRRPFPALTELLDLLRGLGWRKAEGQSDAA